MDQAMIEWLCVELHCQSVYSIAVFRIFSARAMVHAQARAPTLSCIEQHAAVTLKKQ